VSGGEDHDGEKAPRRRALRPNQRDRSVVTRRRARNTRAVRISAIQLEIDDHGTERRFETAIEAIRQEAARGAELVVLPELWSVGAFGFDDYPVLAEPLDGPLARRLSGLASELGILLHGGSIPERDGDRLYNTAVIFDRDGTLLGSYRKMHLFGYGSREPEVLSSGDQVVTVPLGACCAGLAICYDLRFPELFRHLVDQGAELVLLPSGWPVPRLGAWKTLGRARAIENQLAYIGCNCAGRQAGRPFIGASVAYDAWGNCLGELDKRPGVLRVEIDIEAVRAARADFRQLADRVLDLNQPAPA
jgi:predicted amidohydrolase